jgi:hypothetical protein
MVKGIWKPDPQWSSQFDLFKALLFSPITPFNLCQELRPYLFLPDKDLLLDYLRHNEFFNGNISFRFDRYCHRNL